MRLGIEVHRRVFGHIKDAFRLYPQATAIFNCTGIGALTLGGVEDNKIFSARVRTHVDAPDEYISNLYLCSIGSNTSGGGSRGAYP